jgi:hypothetical protein
MRGTHTNAVQGPVCPIAGPQRECSPLPSLVIPRGIHSRRWLQLLLSFAHDSLFPAELPPYGCQGARAVLRTWLEQASPTHKVEPRADLRFWSAVLPDGGQPYSSRPVQERGHIHAWRRLIHCRTNRRISTHGILLTLRGGRRFLYDTHLPHGDWTHGVIMTAALESHSIGVLSVSPCTQGV